MSFSVFYLFLIHSMNFSYMDMMYNNRVQILCPTSKPPYAPTNVPPVIILTLLFKKYSPLSQISNVYMHTDVGQSLGQPSSGIPTRKESLHSARVGTLMVPSPSILKFQQAWCGAGPCRCCELMFATSHVR